MGPSKSIGFREWSLRYISTVAATILVLGPVGLCVSPRLLQFNVAYFTCTGVDGLTSTRTLSRQAD